MTMENKKNWDKLLTVFAELSPLLSALCDLEDALAVSCAKQSQEEIDTLVKDAQASLLRFKGLEKKRLEVQKNLGFLPTSLPEFLKKVPEDDSEVWADRISDLEKNLRRFIESRENAERILQFRLAELSPLLEGKTEHTNFRSRRA